MEREEKEREIGDSKSEEYATFFQMT